MRTSAASGRVGVIIAAAGSSRRMGAVDKVFAQLAGQPLLAFTVTVFQECPAVDDIILVLASKNLEQGRELARQRKWSKVVAICPGGPKRQDSVREGLRRLGDCDWVVIHDGARPCLDSDLVERGLAAARQRGAAIAAVPAKDTIKVVSRRGVIQQTPARQSLWIAQTPQVFRSDLISEAYLQVADEVTDDAALVEQSGHRVAVYMGSYGNIKVTTPEDLAVAEALLRHCGRVPFDTGGTCA